MELSDQGLSISDQYENALIPWNNFIKWEEGKELILLYRLYMVFQMPPKRLFNKETDLQYLREQLVRNNICI